MERISAKEAKKKKKFNRSELSSNSNAFKNGPQYYRIVPTDEGWEEIIYYVDK